MTTAPDYRLLFSNSVDPHDRTRYISGDPVTLEQMHVPEAKLRPFQLRWHRVYAASVTHARLIQRDFRGAQADSFATRSMREVIADTRRSEEPGTKEFRIQLRSWDGEHKTHYLSITRRQARIIANILNMEEK